MHASEVSLDMQKKNICFVHFSCRIDLQFFVGPYNKVFTNWQPPLSVQGADKQQRK